MAMAIAMASLLSLSANPPTLRTSLTLCSTTPFKGNLSSLRPKSSNLFLPLKPKQKQNRNVFNQAVSVGITVSALVTNVHFRLNNLGPQSSSRKKAKRKGRGISAGQGNSCGFGMRGQKSRSGPGVRKGFEGGQMPLYRLRFIYTATLNVLGKARKPAEALNVFHAMQEALAFKSLPRTRGGRRGRVYYCTQAAIRPPTFVFFVNDAELFPETY